MRAAFYEHLLKPLLFNLRPETAHHLAMALLANAPLALLKSFGENAGDERLTREVFGLKFPNPIGLAAGFDKNAVALPAWESLGFGFIEAGTITNAPQPGNPKPRIFRIPEKRALINRMGFNNHGANAVAKRLCGLRESEKWPRIPVGINIGKSKITPLENAALDYLASFEKLFSLGNYFVLNVSSPNTPGLRKLQDKSALDALLRAVQTKNAELSTRYARRTAKPLLIKIAPDLTFAQIEGILELVEAHQLAGIVATNTTLDHSSVPEARRTEGGLSGAPLRERSTEIVRFISSKTSSPIIAAGGIFDADSALEKFDAGAQLIQLYTGFVYRGPALIHEICTALSRTSRRQG
jgi:dihydroorotate dehydrogenase